MNPSLPDRDLAKGHRYLQDRWQSLQVLLNQAGLYLVVNEVYRPDDRQRWLYGAGRTPEQLLAKQLPPDLARPNAPVVTNAWSARTSPHGWLEGDTPAACAMDVVPVGEDGRPWTADDPWDLFVATVAKISARVGLMHFHAPGKAVWDKPHVQLIEWSDRECRLLA